jgi:hypothetical protein
MARQSQALLSAPALDTADLMPDPPRRSAPPERSVFPSGAGVRQREALPPLAASDPLALIRRPDFFSVIPRARYAHLKTAYVSGAERREPAFRDIILTLGERDFAWSRSCDRISGECNPYAQEAFYRKNEQVSPETLTAIDEAGLPDDSEPSTLDEPDASEEEKAAMLEFAESFRSDTEEDGEGRSGSAVAGLGERVRGLLSSLFGQHVPPSPTVSAAASAFPDGLAEKSTPGRGSSIRSGAPQRAPRADGHPEHRAQHRAVRWALVISGLALFALGVRRRFFS